MALYDLRRLVQGCKPPTSPMSRRCGRIIAPVAHSVHNLATRFQTETDPGLAIWSVAVAALLVIFGMVSLSLACWRKNDEIT
jgi:hypothetical protein